MAATTNKPSPSNRPVEGTSDTNLKDPGSDTAEPKNETPAVESPAVAAAAAVDSPAPAAEEITERKSSISPIPTEAIDSLPTYASIEASAEYLLAKRHLADGKFDEAMSVIEKTIIDTKELLQELTGIEDSEEFALHESMAPLHYLYGTTLLYSIEESDQEVTTAGSAISTAVVEGDQAAVAAAKAASAPAEDGETPAAEGEENNAPASAEEDFEIAWENLETARTIMSKMPVTDKLELDMAQVLLRSGDLQLLSGGRSENAIQDYQSCLRLRKKSPFLAKFDRKLADVHYQLALAHMGLASKAEEETSTSDEDGDTTKSKDSAEEERIKEAKKSLARGKGAYHYVECCKCFCGQIANMCTVDPSTILENLLVGGDDDDKSGGKGKASFKTTGEEDDEMEAPKVAGDKLRTLMERTLALVAASESTLSADQKAKVDEFIDMMEDIQEVVDGAEVNSKGVQEVTNMKAEVSAMAAADSAEDGKKSEDAAEGTTSIGFGATASSGVAVAAAAASANADQTARPMMVVKKKKKRAAVEPVVEAAENKKPKTG